MSIGSVGDSPQPVATPPVQEPVTQPAAPEAPPKTETVNRVKQAEVPSSYERQGGHGSLDQPKTDEGKEIAAAKQQLFGSLGALGPGGKIDGAPVEQRAQEIQGLLQKAGVPAEKAATAGDVLRSYQSTLAAGGHDASGLETAIGKAEKAGVLSASDAGTVREIAYANLPEAAAANAAKSSGDALQSAITQAEGGNLPDAAALRDQLERGGVEHKYAQAAANAVRHLERAEEASQRGDTATVDAELGFLRAERAKAVKGGALTGQPLAALNEAVARLQGDRPPTVNFAAPQSDTTTAAPQPAATTAAPATGSATPRSTTAAPTPETAAAPKPGSAVEISKEILTKAGTAAAPELQAAATKAASGDYAGAFAALGRAGKTAAPEVVAQVASKLGDRLPENGAGGVARAVLKDPKAVSALVSDPVVQSGVAKLAKGDLSAIKDIASAPGSGAVLDAALSSPPVKANLDKLGLSPADAKTLAKGVPDLIQASVALGNGDFKGTLSHLGDAAKQVGPEPVAKVVSKLADRLPETGAGGVARSILKDQKAVSTVLTDPALRASVGKLASGDFSALKDIASSPAGGAVLDAALTSPGIKSSLEKLGLTTADAKSLAKGVPDLVQAGVALGNGDYKSVLSHLGDAAKQVGPEPVAHIVSRVADRLPETGAGGVARAVLKDQKAVTAILTDSTLPAAVGKLASGDISSIKDIATSPAGAAVTDAALNSAPVKAGLQKLGLTPTDAKALAKGVPDLIKAGEDVSNGNFSGALSALGDAAKQVGPEPIAKIASKIGSTLPQSGPGGVARAILQDQKAVTAVLTDPKLPAAVGKLASGDLSALKDVAASPGGAAVIDAALASPPLKEGLGKLGLTADDVKAAGRALPDFLRAGEALGKGDATGALRALGDAATHAGPDAVSKAITKAAAQLPETGALGVARALFSDQALVKKVLTNPETRKAFDAIASGKPEAAASAVGTLLKDPSIRDASLGALANDKQLLSKLAPLGIKDAKDLQAVGSSLGDLLGAEESARAGNYGDAISSLGKAAKDLPPELRGRIAGQLADRAHAPPWLKEALVGAAGLLDNPAVQKSLGGAFTALKSGNVGDLVTNLASAGKAIASASPEVASGFIDTLGKLPGSLGKLFQDKQFNQSLVKSGAVNELLDAASALAHGNLSDAASAVAGAGAKLLGEGEHFKVAGQELPFGKQGIENLTRAFGRFVDALPPSVKTKITEEAVKLGAKAGLKSVPLLGNLVNAGAAVGDAADLYQAIRASPRNNLNIALSAAQVGLDVAGVVPGLNSVTGPLGIVLGTAKVIVGGANLIGDLKSFQSSLVSL